MHQWVYNISGSKCYFNKHVPFALGSFHSVKLCIILVLQLCYFYPIFILVIAFYFFCGNGGSHKYWITTKYIKVDLLFIVINNLTSLEYIILYNTVSFHCKIQLEYIKKMFYNKNLIPILMWHIVLSYDMLFKY
jgi:hypothetical protein